MLYSLCGSSSSVNASKLTSVPGTNQYSVISVKFLSQGNSGVPGWDSNLRLTGSDLMFALLRTIKTLDLPYDIQIELFDKLLSLYFYKKKKPLFVTGHMAPEQNFYIQYIMKYMVT